MPTPAFIACLLTASAFFIWSLFDRHFIGADGFPLALACFPWAVGSALACLALADRSGWRASGFWFAVALLGQAGALQLYTAGPVAFYPVYYAENIEYLPGRVALTLVLGQTLCVIAGMLRAAGPLFRWAREQIGPLRLNLLLLFVFLTCGVFSPKIGLWRQKSGYALLLQLLGLANLILAVRALPKDTLACFGRRLVRLCGSPSGHPEPGTLDRFAWLVAASALLVTTFLCVFVYQAHPHVPDEVNYIMQARYFADGLLHLPIPPVPEAFEIDLLFMENDRWYAPTPPGWPAILALGYAINAPWLVNPLLSGLCILFAYLLVRELADRFTARLAILLLACSPWFLFIGMSFMPHPLPMTVALLAALGIARAKRGCSPIWGWVAGACVGVASLTRPLEAVALGSVLGLWAIGFGGARLRPLALAGLILGAVTIGALNLSYNLAMTGSPTEFALMRYFSATYEPGINNLGFGPNRGMPWGWLNPYPGHGLRDVLVNAQFNFFALGMDLHGWSVISTLGILLVFLLGKWQRIDRQMLCAIAVVIFYQSFYWFGGGADFGARYWYLIALPCIVLTLRGSERLGGLLNSGPHTPTQLSEGRLRTLAAIAGLCMLAWATFIPWRVTDKYYHYRQGSSDVRQLAEQVNFGRSLILMGGDRAPDYADAAIYNPLDLEAPEPIYAWDRSPEVRERLLRHYHDRPVWIISGPTLTGDGYKIIEGPLSADDLLDRQSEE